ncbi:hypothetical protein GPJ56_007104 [Histomonas meleagridis]|uniref:uncharacterized protein n=1 Tax=Histomonas meleagridis TaxID=135588 RepID=UPI00355A520E|nr:hypothetical protein GPJ56_007104 [Histomonas meleagridis]KAH0796101.1 hypothetical protein GO595_011068 [Histomonas meleagridis]
MNSEIPFPSDEYLEILNTNENEQITSADVAQRVDRIISEIEANDTAIIDMIGEQMKQVSELFERTILASQNLFEALMKLKDSQMNIVTNKKAATVELLQKLETSMGYIRKL